MSVRYVIWQRRTLLCKLTGHRPGPLNMWVGDGRSLRSGRYEAVCTRCGQASGTPEKGLVSPAKTRLLLLEERGVEFDDNPKEGTT